MALSTPVLLTDDASGGSGITSSSVSPTANALILVFFVSRGGTQRTLSSVSSTFSTGTWTTDTNVDMDDFDGSNGCHVFAWAIATASPGSGTVTVSLSGNQTNNIIQVVEITGHDTTTPIRQSVDGLDTSTTANVTLASGPLSGSCVFGAHAGADEGSGHTPASGFTELSDLNHAPGGVTSRQSVQYDLTSPNQTSEATGVGTAGNRYSIAVEVQEVVAGATRRVFVVS